MSSKTISQYRIYCNTEQTWVSGWGASAPATCYNNNAHAVNASSVQLLDTVAENRVTISEEQPGVTTGGYYGVESFSFTAAANTTTVFNSSYPFDISMLACTLQADSTMVGDRVTFDIGADTVVGTVAASAAVGATAITVSPPTLGYIYVGLVANITDGTNTNSLGRIVSIDSVNAVVTCETATTAAFASGAYFRVTRRLVSNFRIGVSGQHVFGEHKSGSSFIQKNIAGTCTYTNTSPTTDKTVTFTVEYIF